MREERFCIGHIPAVLCGEPSERVWLFLHGKQGCKEEGLDFAELVCPKGWQVCSIDMPEHGQRQGGPEQLVPWQVVPELELVMACARSRWRQVALRANSIGAWFAMQAFGKEPPVRSLFVSPILDMAELIRRMMGWAGVTEAELEARGALGTAFGETLSWRYWQHALDRPITRWDSPTAVLYGGTDNLTPRSTAEAFAARFHADLTVMEEGEHWFHTPEQLEVLRQWTLSHLEEGGPWSSHTAF